MSDATAPLVPAARPRLAWMDTMRGVAIFLVVFTHAIDLSPLGAPRGLLVVDHALAPFRVPALMFLSGMLLPASLAKPWPVYLRGKVSRILWPYLLWSVLILFLSSFGEAGPSPLLELFARPTSPTWFVGYLFVFYVVVMFARPAVRTWMLLPVLAAAVLFDPVQGLVPAPEVIHGFRTRFFFTFFCFLAGDLLTRHRERWLPSLTRAWVTVACLLLAVPAAVLSVLDFAVKYQPLFVVSTLAGVVAAIPGLTRLAGTATGRFVATQGRSSIVFYLVHYPAQVVAWHLALAIGVRSGLVIVIMNVVAGLAAGFAMVWLRRRSRFVEHLFDLHLERFGRHRGRPAAPAAPATSAVSIAPATTTAAPSVGQPRSTEVSGASPAPAAEA